MEVILLPVDGYARFELYTVCQYGIAIWGVFSTNSHSLRIRGIELTTSILARIALKVRRYFVEML